MDINGGSEGEIGVLDFQQVNRTAIVERTCRFWGVQGICGRWFKQRYVKDASMSNIRFRYNDSSSWKAVLKAKYSTARCEVLQTNGEVEELTRPWVT